jgi:hypothetical protein
MSRRNVYLPEVKLANETILDLSECKEKGGWFPDILVSQIIILILIFQYDIYSIINIGQYYHIFISLFLCKPQISMFLIENILTESIHC